MTLSPTAPRNRKPSNAHLLPWPQSQSHLWDLQVSPLCFSSSSPSLHGTVTLNGYHVLVSFFPSSWFPFSTQQPEWFCENATNHVTFLLKTLSRLPIALHVNTEIPKMTHEALGAVAPEYLPTFASWLSPLHLLIRVVPWLSEMLYQVPSLIGPFPMEHSRPCLSMGDTPEDP